MATTATAPTVSDDVARGKPTREGAVEHQSTGKKILKSAMLALIVLWCTFPFVWLISTSLKFGSAALNDPNLFRGPFGLQNYASVFAQDFAYNLRNSFIVAAATTVLCIAIGGLASYALARLHLRGKTVLLTLVLAVSLFPAVALVPPLYEAWLTFGLLNTYASMILPYIALNLPLTIFLLTTYFNSIPGELEEAARVDGASPFRAFTRVILPLAAPGLAAAAILTFVAAWNEYLLARTFAPRSLAAQTVPVAIANFTGAVQFQRPIGTITAACVIVTIPMILLALVFQKRIVAGLTSGGVKA